MRPSSYTRTHRQAPGGIGRRPAVVRRASAGTRAEVSSGEVTTVTRREHMAAIDRKAAFGAGNTLFLYLKEIARHPRLTASDESRLAARIKQRDRAALEQLIRSNLRFVVSVAKNYQNQGLALPDLINEGNIGLIRAARRFDEGKNFKFISYAVWWIRQAILQALAEQSRIVKLPLNRVGLLYKVGKVQMRFEQTHNRLPGPEEIAGELGLSEKEVQEALQIGTTNVSLDSPLQNDEDICLLDRLCVEDQQAPDEAIAALSLREEIASALDELNNREREVIRLYFGIGEEMPYTLEEIGRRFNLTRERTRQIKERAIIRLKQSSHRRHLMTFYR